MVTVLGAIVIALLLVDIFVIAINRKSTKRTIWTKIIIAGLVIILEIPVIVLLCIDKQFPIFNIAIICIEALKIYTLSQSLIYFEILGETSQDNSASDIVDENDIVV